MITFKTKGLKNFSIEGDINEIKRGLKELSAVYRGTIRDIVEDGVLFNDGIDMLLDLGITKEDIDECVRWGDNFDDEDKIQEIKSMTSAADLLLELKGPLWAYEQLNFMRFLLASCEVEIAVKDGHFGTEIEISSLFD
jgi:hypothetical protein